jgi:hypothetical protein
MPIDPEFLEMLACPACRSPLAPRGEGRLLCASCGRGYPIRDGIPVLLLDEAVIESEPEEPAGVCRAASDTAGGRA